MNTQKLSFELFESIEDKELEIIKENYNKPEIECFVSIDKSNFWKYVTESENVYFYKVYERNTLVGTAHCEVYDGVLYLAVVVFTEFHNRKIGTSIVRAVIDGITGIEFNEIHVSIDKKNTASIRLFSNMGFISMGQEDELIDFRYIM